MRTVDWTYEWDDQDKVYRIIGEAGGTVATTHSRATAEIILAAVCSMNRNDYDAIIQSSKFTCDD